MATDRIKNPGVSSRLRAAGWSAALLMLLIPAVAMQFTAEVNWTLGDFLFAGALLGGAGLVLELAVRKSADGAYRAAAAVAVGTAVLLVWINAAVGIIGDESNAANLLFAGVLAIAVTGALLARFRAPGLSRTFLATALAQVAAAVVAVVAGGNDPVATPPGELAGLTLFFAALWLTCAGLFRRSANASRAPHAA